MSGRWLLFALAAVAVAAVFAFAIVSMQQSDDPQIVADFPDPKTLETGDFVWTKKKGAILPFDAPLEPSAEEKAWEAQRDEMIKDAVASGASEEVTNRLKTMTYAEYQQAYFGQPAPTEDASPEARSLGGRTFAVGHVAIVERDDQGALYVLEATPTEGGVPGIAQGAVIRTKYDDWLKGHNDYQVWHGRIKGASRDDRAKIADEARKQLGKPYKFFNFNLNDDAGFYCSKLAWMSSWRGLKIAPDDNPDPLRGKTFPPWFSPRQLANAPRVELLHKPGEY